MTRTELANQSDPAVFPEFLDQTVHFAVMTGLIKMLAPFQHRGLSRIIPLLKAIFPLEDKFTRAKLGSDAIFSFPTYDDYWGYFLINQRCYEPEIASLLMRLKDIPFGFMDCGANYGYWSVLVSSTLFGKHPTIAVEASSSTFGELQKNARFNDDRYICLKRAISNRSGAMVKFSRHSHHGGRSILTNAQNDRSIYEEVRTETIDKLITTHMYATPSVVCKLDVEGAEIAALEGATRALLGDTVFIYEDHGKDFDCLPSRYLLDRGIEVFIIAPDGTLLAVGDIKEIQAEKTNKKRGYNFVAIGRNGPLCDMIRSLSTRLHD